MTDGSGGNTVEQKSQERDLHADRLGTLYTKLGRCAFFALWEIFQNGVSLKIQEIDYEEKSRHCNGKRQ